MCEILGLICETGTVSSNTTFVGSLVRSVIDYTDMPQNRRLHHFGRIWDLRVEERNLHHPRFFVVPNSSHESIGPWFSTPVSEAPCFTFMYSGVCLWVLWKWLRPPQVATAAVCRHTYVHTQTRTAMHGYWQIHLQQLPLTPMTRIPAQKELLNAASHGEGVQTDVNVTERIHIRRNPAGPVASYHSPGSVGTFQDLGCMNMHASALCEDSSKIRPE